MIYFEGCRSFFSLLSIAEVIIDKIILNNNAHQKLSMLKPSTSLLASKTTSVLITNKNNPSVINVTGKVNKIKRGLTNIFSRASTIANIRAVQKSVTCTPCNKCASANEIAATTNMRIKKPILVN